MSATAAKLGSRALGWQVTFTLGTAAVVSLVPRFLLLRGDVANDATRGLLAAVAFGAVFRNLRATNFAHLPSGPGGIGFLVASMSFVLVFVVVIGLQALAMFLRGVLVLGGREELLPDRLRYSGGEG